MNNVPYVHFLALALPEVILVVFGFLILTVDSILRFRSVRYRFAVAATLGTAGCFLACARLTFTHETTTLSQGMFAVTPLTCSLQELVLGLAAVSLLLSLNSDFTEYVGEYVLLLLLATVGMMFLISSRNLLTTFVSLELLSLSLYTLTAFDKRSTKGSEAALKYFFFGAVSAAIFLFGLTYLYGASGSASYSEISAALSNTGLSPLIAVAIIATMIGFGFKVAAAPAHFWAPDVYEGAPNPVAGFIASSSKVASFFVLFVFATACLNPVAGSSAWMHFHAGWTPIIGVFAAVSMIVGNLGAIVQGGVRRLLAYSAVAHTGYMLIAVAVHTRSSLEALLYYVFTYSLATLGSFAVIDVVEKNSGNDKVEQFDGLVRRAPLLSTCFFLFLLSQTGIPPLAGFFAKFYLFVAALQSPDGYSSLLWLVVLAIAMSAVSLYYYLRVLKHIYVLAPTEPVTTIQVPWLTTAIVVLLAGSVLALGLFPEALRGWIHIAVVASGY